MKHIRTRKRQTLLAVGAVALAVAITIISRASVNGVQDLLFNIIFEAIPQVIVTPKEGEEYIYLYKTLAESIWTITGVTVVSPALTTTATLVHEDNVENVALSGIIPAELNKISKIGDKYMVQGDLNAIQNGRRIVLSQKMVDKLDLKLGEDVEASFPDAKTLNLVVVGIYDTGTPWDDSVFVSQETARKFLGKGDVITDIQIKLDDIYQADAVAAEIASRGYTARSWQTFAPEILETIKIESFSNNLIMMLILVIASFGIANVMNMLVLEKTKEIGMLLAMGATRSNIRTIFLFESGILGLIGGIFGCALGYLVSIYLNSLKIVLTVPNAGHSIVLTFIVDPWDLVAFSLLAFFLSIVAGVYPAHKASQLDPVIALGG
ncbi:MAG: ABC transporter permease [Methanotrichaceae archaeon]